jgi:hypothetical protein
VKYLLLDVKPTTIEILPKRGRYLCGCFKVFVRRYKPADLAEGAVLI